MMYIHQEVIPIVPVKENKDEVAEAEVNIEASEGGCNDCVHCIQWFGLHAEECDKGSNHFRNPDAALWCRYYFPIDLEYPASVTERGAI